MMFVSHPLLLVHSLVAECVSEYHLLVRNKKGAALIHDQAKKGKKREGSLLVLPIQVLAHSLHYSFAHLLNLRAYLLRYFVLTHSFIH